jgi:hypothetical protein
VSATRDHYEVLGVGRGASHGELRDAYRRRMRTLHPDAGARAGATSEIAAVTEAWHVLGDAGRRARYDADRDASPRGSAAGGRGQRPAGSGPGPVAGDDMYAGAHDPRYAPAPRRTGPARFPWRTVGLIVAAGVVVVLALHALGVTDPPPGPDSLITSGSCVDIDDLGTASEVDCDGPHEAVVRQLVGFDMRCPSDTVGYRDRQGMGTACVDLTAAAPDGP